jgi:hypothetical protein
MIGLFVDSLFQKFNAQLASGRAFNYEAHLLKHRVSCLKIVRTVDPVKTFSHLPHNLNSKIVRDLGLIFARCEIQICLISYTLGLFLNFQSQ